MKSSSRWLTVLISVVHVNAMGPRRLTFKSSYLNGCKHNGCMSRFSDTYGCLVCFARVQPLKNVNLVLVQIFATVATFNVSDFTVVIGDVLAFANIFSCV